MTKKIITTAVFCSIVLATISVAAAATKGRILTNGKVTMYKNNKVVNSFTNQGPIDDSALIACAGNCLIKIKGVSLIAEDKTRFAVREMNNSLSLFVETGKVNFAVSDLSKEFSFYHPGNSYVKSVGFITSASTASSAKGFMQVSDKGARIGMEEGTIITRTNDGTQEIGPGQAVLLAQVPPSAVNGQANAKKEDCVDDPDTARNECCEDNPDTEEDECDEAAGLLLAGGGSLTSAETAGWAFAGAATLTAGIIIIDEINEDDPVLRQAGGGDVPIVLPPPSTSPNR